jgi:hypothetical protein
MAILGGGKADKAEPLVESSPEDAYIDEFLAAVKEGDSEGAKSAFKSAVAACSKSKSEEYEEEEAEEEA